MKYKDSDDQKWEYTEHAKVKHKLLEKYLKGWIVIVGKYNNKIAYFDGFAGRGEYTDGSSGSPILAMQACQSVADYSNLKNLTFSCCFIERDKNNFDNLIQVIERVRINYPKVSNVNYLNGDFDVEINKVLDKISNRLVPSFFFIDPFGYTGVQFSTIERILSIPKTEVFFNFMVRDINRFLKLPNQEENLYRLFGDYKWKQTMSLSGERRQNALRDLYIQKLYESNSAKYVLPFKICEDDRCATLYYLLYATNSFKGLEVMKSIMFNQNERYAYLGPDEYEYQLMRNQPRLFDVNILDLKNYLQNNFEKNKVFTYDQIREATYLTNPCIDKHYRAALKELEKDRKISVRRVTSATARGLSGNDEIKFF